MVKHTQTMFKVNNKDTPYSGVSIVTFEQVNAGWDDYIYLFKVNNRNTRKSKC